MTAREPPGDSGQIEARKLVIGACAEIRQARIAAGWSQELVAHAAGLSRPVYGRLERGDIGHPTLTQLCRAARAVGLETSLSHFPTGVRLRDRPQLRILDVLAGALASPLRMPREVTLPIPGDLRAWDAAITDDRSMAFVEGVSRIGDTQAMQRRIDLKLRDDPRSNVVMLAVSNTRHNRAVLAEHREALRHDFPLDGATILRALRAGRLPTASGIVLL